MRILIYGAGAVGCYLAGHLALAGHCVTLLDDGLSVMVIRSSGLRLRQAGRTEYHTPPLSVVGQLRDALEVSTGFDWVAFTMKSYDTVAAIRDLAGVWPQPPPIVSFQEGVGNEESLRAAFGSHSVVAATVTSCVSMTEPGTVVEVRRGGIGVGMDAPPAVRVAEALRQTTLPVKLAHDAAGLKWSKLLVSMIGNATAAILDMHPRDIFTDPALFAIERAALREMLAVASLRGIRLVNLPGAPARTLAWAGRWLPAPMLRVVMAWHFSRRCNEDIPSLLRELRAGERRTEVAWLNGAVAQAADSIRRLAPINHALALVVSDIAAGRTPWGVYRRRPDMLLTAIRAVQGLEW